MKDLILARVDRARLALLEARDAISAKKVADLAKAAEVFATRQKSEEARGYAHEIYVEALRLEGAYLEEVEKNKGGRPAKTSSPRVLVSVPTLKEQEIPRRQSVLAQSVSKAAREAPEVFEAVRSGAKLATIRRHFAKAEHAAKLKATEGRTAALTGPYDLILADPPWRYDFEEAANREIENQYPTATLAEICRHRPELAKDAILFLWATAPKLAEALQVMGAWGFSYRTCAVWDKTKLGMGYWFRIQHELLLVGVRGKPGTTPECERRSSIFVEGRTGHSVKPVCVYEWIERAFPSARKLEMYCRKPRPGWAAWGNEV